MFQVISKALNLKDDGLLPTNSILHEIEQHIKLININLIPNGFLYTIVQGKHTKNTSRTMAEPEQTAEEDHTNDTITTNPAPTLKVCYNRDEDINVLFMEL
jgi:hypothetical protein